jgi:dipeptidyl aminopeptidase/acylaminoacyl peptidase
LTFNRSVFKIASYHNYTFVTSKGAFMLLRKLFWGAFLVVGVVAIQALYTPSQAIASSIPDQNSERPLIPRKLLFGNPVKAMPQISPKGSKLAYLAPDANNVLNVWIKDLKNDIPDVKVTSDAKRGVRQYIWKYDEESILYLQDKDGDENTHIYQTNLSTGQTIDFTPFEGVKAGIVDYNHRFPDEALIQMNKNNPALYDVYRLNLSTGELKLDTENTDGAIEWVPDHQMHVRAFTTLATDGSTLISVRDAVDAPWREIMKMDSSDVYGGIVDFSEDGNSLLCLASLDSDTVRLIQIETSSGKYTVIAENPKYDLAKVVNNPLTHKLEFIAYEGDKYTQIVLDAEMKSDFEWLNEQNLAGQADYTIQLVSRDLSNQKWVIAVQSDVHPSSFYLFNRSNKDLTFLFSTQPELDKFTLSPMKPISFIARDGMEIHAYLTLPAHAEAKNLPLVLNVHGGPWSRDSWGCQPGVQWLADRGYAVLQINYRGSSGYGKDYLNAGNREWGNKMHLDLLDGKQWAIDNGFADPTKVAIYGGSYGGYATLAALAFTPEEFCCGVDIVGPSNLITLLQSFPAYWGPLKAKTNIRIGCLETEPDFLKERSPLFKANQITKPLLIAQGANDPRVKQAESDQIVDAMRLNNLPVDYLLFLDEGHGFAVPENRMKFMAATEAFLASYLGGAAEAPKAEENWDSLKR